MVGCESRNRLGTCDNTRLLKLVSKPNPLLLEDKRSQKSSTQLTQLDISAVFRVRLVLLLSTDV